MNIKFVVGGVVVIGALFLGTEIYWKKQFEQKLEMTSKVYLF